LQASSDLGPALEPGQGMARCGSRLAPTPGHRLVNAMSSPIDSAHEEYACWVMSNCWHSVVISNLVGHENVE